MAFDRRAALEEAFDSVADDEQGVEHELPSVVEAETEPVVESPTGEVEAEADPAEVEAKAANEKTLRKEKTRTKGVPPEERVKPAEVGEKTPEQLAAESAAKPTEKAPLGWGPARDALWAKVPPDVRAVIAKREQDIQNGMSQAGRIRAVADEYRDIVAPHQDIIARMGSTPKQALSSVMQTATALIVGTQAQKVAVLAEMIDRYGVDLPELDKALTESLNRKKNGGGGAAPQPQPINFRAVPELQPLFKLQEQYMTAQQQRNQQMEQEANTAIQSMQDKPYFNDVKDDIADIMEISAKRGIVLTIQQAYDKACQLNPEVAKLLPKNTANNPGAVARARKASSSVKGAPGGPVGTGKVDRRSAIEAAWNEST